MHIGKFTDILGKEFPLSLQEDYDNCGGQVLFPGEELRSILIALDADMPVIEEAMDLKCSMILTHHPLIFNPLRSITSGDPLSDMIIRLIENRTSLYSLHTNLDRKYYAKTGEALGFTRNSPLMSRESLEDGTPTGFGSLSELDTPTTLGDLLSLVRRKLSLAHVLFTGRMDRTIRRVAILNGAGGRSVERIMHAFDIDCIITGDVGYHQAKSAQAHDIPVIDAGHFGTERIFPEFLRKDIMDCLTKSGGKEVIPIHVSTREKNPFDLSA